MNFGTHKQQIVDSIEIALTKEKTDLIERFKIILNKCSSLLKSKRFDFWLQQLDIIPSDKIPLTKFGLDNARCSVAFLRDSDRHDLESGIVSICEQLFTYSNKNDLCPLQCEYHYYFYLTENKIFKQSEMGYSDLDKKKVSISEIRIATIGEIQADSSEYIRSMDN